MKTSLKVLGAILALGFSTTAAHATAITVDGGWQSFIFGGVGSGASGNPYTYSSLSSTEVSVTDDYLSGDVFEVFDFGISLGLTSAITGGPTYSGNPDGAFVSGAYSHGTFLVGAGSHSITIVATASPFGSGGAWLRVDTAASVPDSGSTLFLCLLGALAAIKSRRFLMA